MTREEILIMSLQFHLQDEIDELASVLGDEIEMFSDLIDDEAQLAKRISFLHEVKNTLESQQKEIERLESMNRVYESSLKLRVMDSVRYKWLRNQSGWPEIVEKGQTPENFDKMIDRLMSDE